MKEIYTIMIILTIRFPKKKSAIKQSSTVCNDLFSPPKCLITGERLLILRLSSDPRGGGGGGGGGPWLWPVGL